MEPIKKNRKKTPTKRSVSYENRCGFLAKKTAMTAAETGADILLIIVPPSSSSSSSLDKDSDTETRSSSSRSFTSDHHHKKIFPMVVQTAENIMDRFLGYGSDYHYYYGKIKLANKIGTLDNRKVHMCLDESGRFDAGDDNESDQIPVRTRKHKKNTTSNSSSLSPSCSYSPMPPSTSSLQQKHEKAKKNNCHTSSEDNLDDEEGDEDDGDNDEYDDNNTL
jgi:hypothetical protein